MRTWTLKTHFFQISYFKKKIMMIHYKTKMGMQENKTRNGS